MWGGVCFYFVKEVRTIIIIDNMITESLIKILI